MCFGFTLLYEVWMFHVSVCEDCYPVVWYRTIRLSPDWMTEAADTCENAVGYTYTRLHEVKSQKTQVVYSVCIFSYSERRFVLT